MSEALVIGLDRIAERLGRDRKTVRHWIARGILAVRRAGPFRNSAIAASAEDVDRLKAAYGGGQEAR